MFIGSIPTTVMPGTINRAGTHKIEMSDIIIFMHSIQPSIHKTSTHICFQKHWPQHFLLGAESSNSGIILGSDGGLILGGHF